MDSSRRDGPATASTQQVHSPRILAVSPVRACVSRSRPRLGIHGLSGGVRTADPSHPSPATLRRGHVRRPGEATKVTSTGSTTRRHPARTLDRDARSRPTSAPRGRAGECSRGGVRGRVGQNYATPSGFEAELSPTSDRLERSRVARSSHHAPPAHDNSADSSAAGRRGAYASGYNGADARRRHRHGIFPSPLLRDDGSYAPLEGYDDQPATSATQPTTPRSAVRVPRQLIAPRQRITYRSIGRGYKSAATTRARHPTASTARATDVRAEIVASVAPRGGQSPPGPASPYRVRELGCVTST